MKNKEREKHWERVLKGIDKAERRKWETYMEIKISTLKDTEAE